MKKRMYAAPAVEGLKQLGRFASLNQIIHILANPLLWMLHMRMGPQHLLCES